MKNILILLLGLMYSCKKDESASSRTTNPNCSINFNLVKDIQWHNVNNAFSDLTFATGGIYYEDSVNDGNWTLPNNCDSIYITRPSNSFYYKVISVTNDSLKLYTSTFGNTTLYR